MQEGERFLSSIFASILDGISVIDLNFNIVQVNSTMEKWYKHALPLVGEKCYEAHHGRSEPCQPCPAYRTMLTGEPHFETIPLKGDDGRSVGWADVHAFPWLSKTTGKMKGVIKYIRDITYRVEAEQTVEESLRNLQKALNGTVKALANTLESKDPYTAGHQRRVVQLACALAQELGESPHYIEGMRVMGFLHDLGKIAVPGEILSKPSRLSEYEFNLIKIHPQAGYDILKDIDFPWPVALAVLQHHERLDGSGYPHGLSGHDIIREAKILAVADVVEAIASHRPYRPALGLDQAMAEISRHQGVLYDPAVVQTCLRLLSEKRFTFSLNQSGDRKPGGKFAGAGRLPAPPGLSILRAGSILRNFRFQGKRKEEGAAAAGGRVHPDAAAVGVNDPLDRGQPQSEALGIPLPLPPIEDFEEMGQISRGDPRPLVVNGKPDGRVLHPDLQPHLTAGGAVLDGILQQVLQHPPEQERIGFEARAPPGQNRFPG